MGTQKIQYEKRRFVRHPADIPLEAHVVSQETASLVQKSMRNISVGGISFESHEKFKKDTILQIKIPIVHTEFEAQVRVVWCHKHSGYYEVGVEFLEDRDAFRIRMVEQICHIEQYKKDALKNEGRSLTIELAAAEWITKHANDFPWPNLENL